MPNKAGVLLSLPFCQPSVLFLVQHHFFFWNLIGYCRLIGRYLPDLSSHWLLGLVRSHVLTGETRN